MTEAYMASVLGFAVGVMACAVVVAVAVWRHAIRLTERLTPTSTTTFGMAPGSTWNTTATATTAEQMLEDDEDGDAARETAVIHPAHGLVAVPPDVVAACIAEARGNHAVLDRSLLESANLLAMGMPPRGYQ